MILRTGTDYLLNAGVPLAETLRVPLLAAAFALLLIALWSNRGYPGISLAFVGILSNAVVIIVNGGYMPIYGPSLEAAGPDPGRRDLRTPRDPAGRTSTRTSCSTSARSPTSSRSLCR